MIRSYSELSRISDFTDRYKYLALRGSVAAATFGFDRWMNQGLYVSREWKQTRVYVIARDEGCDLGIPGYEIHTRLYVHHMNPLTPEQIESADNNMFDPEYLITTTHATHNAIHYGDEKQLPVPFVPRRRGDTRLW